MTKAAVPSILVVVMLRTFASFADAQQPTKVPRIGFLTGGSSTQISARIEALHQGLRDLGYIEEKT
jgi:hypothetical protein